MACAGCEAACYSHREEQSSGLRKAQARPKKPSPNQYREPHEDVQVDGVKQRGRSNDIQRGRLDRDECRWF